MFVEYDKYLNDLQMDKSPHTIRSYTGILSRFFNHHNISDISGIKKFSEDQASKYQEYLLNNIGGKNKNTITVTVNNHIRVLKVFFNWLKEKHCIKKNTFDGLKYLREKNKKIPIYLSIEERDSMINACQSLRDKAMLGIMFFQGLRREEVVGLKISDINNGDIIIIGKGGKIDVQKLSPYVETLIYNYLETRGDNNIYLFVARHGFGHDNGDFTGITAETVRQRIKYIAKKAGFNEKRIEEISAHTTRRTCACQLALAGENTFTIQAHLRHSSITITEKYIKPAMKDLSKKAVLAIPVPKE